MGEVFLTMSINTFVYPYPISIFIISRLGMTVEQFCELHGYKQSTVASWVTRNRAVKTLPCDFLYCLSLSSGWSMDGVYRHLLVLEEKFLKSMDPKKKKEQSPPRINPQNQKQSCNQNSLFVDPKLATPVIEKNKKKESKGIRPGKMR